MHSTHRSDHGHRLDRHSTLPPLLCASSYISGSSCEVPVWPWPVRCESLGFTTIRGPQTSLEATRPEYQANTEQLTCAVRKNLITSRPRRTHQISSSTVFWKNPYRLVQHCLLMTWIVMVDNGLPRSLTKCFVSNVECFAFMKRTCLRSIWHIFCVCSNNESPPPFMCRSNVGILTVFRWTCLDYTSLNNGSLRSLTTWIWNWLVRL